MDENNAIQLFESKVSEKIGQLKMKAKEELEAKTGKKVLSSLNAKSILEERKKIEARDDE